MKICNCQRKCFEYITRFGFLKNDLIKSEYYPEGGTEILIFSLDHDRSFFSYEPRSDLINYVDVDLNHILNGPTLSLCDVAISTLINMCIFASNNLELLYHDIDKPKETYSPEEFKSLIRNNKIEVIIQ